MRLRTAARSAAFLCASALAVAAHARIAVSANDGKQLRPGEGPEARTPDTVAVLNLDHGAAKVLGSVAAPASMIGPPVSVAIAPGGAFAIVTNNQKPSPDNPAKLVPADDVSVIDIADPRRPKLVQSLHAGAGATGVSINRAGTLALVACSDADAVHVFTIRDGRLRPAGVVALPAKTRPIDVVIAPDGKSAWVVGQGAGKLIRLALDGASATLTPTEITVGLNPAGMVISHDGRFAYLTLQGGRLPAPGAAPAPGPKVGAVAAVDLSREAVTDAVDTGPVTEHVGLSPDGQVLAVTVVNGSSAPPSSPAYHAHGLLELFRVDGGQLKPLTTAQTGQWCQGSAWDRTGRTLFLQCAMSKQIEVYRFDGARLTPVPAAALQFDARPGAIATAASR